MRGARGVARRRVERREVVVVELDLGSLGDVVAEPDEDVLDLLHRLADEVLVAGREGLTGQSDVEALVLERGAEGRLLSSASRSSTSASSSRRTTLPSLPITGRSSAASVEMERSISVSGLLRPRTRTRSLLERARRRRRRRWPRDRSCATPRAPGRAPSCLQLGVVHGHPFPGARARGVARRRRRGAARELVQGDGAGDAGVERLDARRRARQPGASSMVSRSVRRASVPGRGRRARRRRRASPGGRSSASRERRAAVSDEAVDARHAEATRERRRAVTSW